MGILIGAETVEVLVGRAGKKGFVEDRPGLIGAISGIHPVLVEKSGILRPVHRADRLSLAVCDDQLPDLGGLI